MPSRELPIPFPASGLVRALGYQTGEPSATHGALNVVPDDSGEARTRGGTRPGVVKRYANQLDGPPRFMVRVATGDEATRVYEQLVIGTDANIYLGRSIASGDSVPITYTEGLQPLTGDLLTEDGRPLLTESGDTLVIDDFQVGAVNRRGVIAYQGQVIIGPNDVKIAEGSGTVDGDQLTDSTVADWTALAIDPDVHWVEIVGQGTTFGTYRIDSVSPGSITFERPANTTAEVVTYVVREGIRVIDPETTTLSLLRTTAGTPPVNADAVAVFRDRLVWAVGRTWFMSRQGDAGDYDYGAATDDPGAAIAGNASDAGQPADPIIAMAAIGLDFLVLFAESSTWMFRGDPGFGGALYALSRSTGCVGPRAWCQGDRLETFFLAKDGLYAMPPGGGDIKALSPGRLPRDLRGIDRDNFMVTLAYDPEDDGVLIFVAPRGGGVGKHWWFDIATESFWPLRLSSSSHQPVDAVTFGGAPDRPRRVVWRRPTGTSENGRGTTTTVSRSRVTSCSVRTPWGSGGISTAS